MMDIEELRETVDSINEGIMDIRNSGITDAALIVLIQEAAPIVSFGTSSKKPSKTMIKAVLRGLDNLQSYVFEEESGDG